jgi:hypothetical protein
MLRISWGFEIQPPPPFPKNNKRQLLAPPPSARRVNKSVHLELPTPIFIKPLWHPQPPAMAQNYLPCTHTTHPHCIRHTACACKYILVNSVE